MPMKTHLYPPYWKQFSEYIRFERAGNRCEKCRIPNGYLKYMSDALTMPEVVHPEDAHTLWHLESWLVDCDYKVTKIVLTTAHLDRESDGICKCEKLTGLKCANPAHVLAMCQRCHLIYDKAKHLKNRLETLAKRNDARKPMIALFEGGTQL